MSWRIQASGACWGFLIGGGLSGLDRFLLLSFVVVWFVWVFKFCLVFGCSEFVVFLFSFFPTRRTVELLDF